MKVSGTSKDYPGLWAAVARSAPAGAEALRADPASFPSRAKVSGMVATMAALDLVFDNLKTVSKTAWQPDAGHPDLVPARESQRLAELFRGLRSDPESAAHPADYQDMLATMIGAAEQLDAAVRAGDVAKANAQFDLATKSCKQCHTSYRDR
jgi:cytochrome c556